MKGEKVILKPHRLPKITSMHSIKQDIHTLQKELERQLNSLDILRSYSEGGADTEKALYSIIETNLIVSASLSNIIEEIAQSIQHTIDR
jgi:hypothetical protein